MKNIEMKKRIRVLELWFFILMLPPMAFAYVGPGAGISFIGALWAVITAILLAIGGFLVWPIRALLRRRKLRKQDRNPNTEKSNTDSK